MRKSQTIVLDFSTCHILSNASKFVELISSYSNENYNIQIIRKNSNICPNTETFHNFGR